MTLNSDITTDSMTVDHPTYLKDSAKKLKLKLQVDRQKPIIERETTQKQCIAWSATLNYFLQWFIKKCKYNLRWHWLPYPKQTIMFHLVNDIKSLPGILESSKTMDKEKDGGRKKILPRMTVTN